MKKKVKKHDIAPRPYFSWSSYNLFGRSPEAWRKRYLLGEKGLQTPAMTFGKKFALAREKGEDEELEHITMFLPTYPRREYEMTATVRIDGKDVILLGIFDECDLRRHIVADDKTGLATHITKKGNVSKEWNQKRVDKEEQLTWYAFIYWKKKGVLPKLRLHWVETEERMGIDAARVIRATGRVETFDTTRTVKDFLPLVEKINKRWRSIVQLCELEWAKVV